MTPSIRKTIPIMLLCIGAALVSLSSLADDRPLIGTAEGQMYPDFLLPTLDGEVKRFSDYRGKKILLFHFASW